MKSFCIRILIFIILGFIAVKVIDFGNSTDNAFIYGIGCMIFFVMGEVDSFLKRNLL